MKGYESIVKELIDAEREWKNAERMIYVTIPVVKDAKLMLKALEGIHNSLFLTISGILKFEYLFKRVELNRDVDKNLETFFSKPLIWSIRGLSLSTCLSFESKNLFRKFNIV